MFTSKRLLTLTLVVGAAIIGGAQESDRGDESLTAGSVAEQLGVFTDHVEVTVTNLYVTVTDRDGIPVTDLTADDFVVTEDGREVEITHSWALPT